MGNNKGNRRKFKVDFSNFDYELTDLLLQITQRYKKNKQSSVKKTSAVKTKKTPSTTVKRKIVKLDLKKIREAIEQGVATAKKNTKK